MDFSADVDLDFNEWRKILFRKSRGTKTIKKEAQSRSGNFKETKSENSSVEKVKPAFVLKPHPACEVPTGWKIIEETETHRMICLKKRKKKSCKDTKSEEVSGGSKLDECFLVLVEKDGTLASNGKISDHQVILDDPDSLDILTNVFCGPNDELDSSACLLVEVANKLTVEKSEEIEDDCAAAGDHVDIDTEFTSAEDDDVEKISRFDLKKNQLLMAGFTEDLFGELCMAKFKELSQVEKKAYTEEKRRIIPKFDGHEGVSRRQLEGKYDPGWPEPAQLSTTPCPLLSTLLVLGQFGHIPSGRMVRTGYKQSRMPAMARGGAVAELYLEDKDGYRGKDVKEAADLISNIVQGKMTKVTGDTLREIKMRRVESFLKDKLGLEGQLADQQNLKEAKVEGKVNNFTKLMEPIVRACKEDDLKNYPGNENVTEVDKIVVEESSSNCSKVENSHAVKKASKVSFEKLMNVEKRDNPDQIKVELSKQVVPSASLKPLPTSPDPVSSTPSLESDDTNVKLSVDQATELTPDLIGLFTLTLPVSPGSDLAQLSSLQDDISWFDTPVSIMCMENSEVVGVPLIEVKLRDKEMAMAVLIGLKHKYPGLEGDTTGSHADILPDKETGLYTLCFTNIPNLIYDDKKSTPEEFVSTYATLGNTYDQPSTPDNEAKGAFGLKYPEDDDSEIDPKSPKGCAGTAKASKADDVDIDAKFIGSEEDDDADIKTETSRDHEASSEESSDADYECESDDLGDAD